MTSSFGTLYRIHTFGESHGPAVGVVIDGCPAGIELDLENIQQQLLRRRPGQSYLTSQRQEKDECTILSGVYKGKTLGSPLAITVRNTDVRSQDYKNWGHVYRPSHADYTYHVKYGYRTPQGGGRASARETIGRVIAGAIARQILKQDLGIETVAWVDSIGEITANLVFTKPPKKQSEVDASLVRCPDREKSQAMIHSIEIARRQGESIGGTIGLVAWNVPPGLGEPVFDKLEAQLAQACLSISACKGFESGRGFAATQMRGSSHNDLFYVQEENDSSTSDSKGGFYKKLKRILTRSNHSGGIQGGISNGMPILLRAAFKPTATIFHEQESVNESGQQESLKAKGRHDPCVLPRAVPIVEAMANMVLLDAYLQQRAFNPEWWLHHANKAD